MPPHPPAIDASLGHIPQGRRETGGLVAISGFYYQWLYSLRLMPLILDGSYDGYRCEDVDDYLAWKIDEQSAQIAKLRVVQVKHRQTDGCILCDTGLVTSVLENFTLLCNGRLARCSGAEIDFRLVYNPVHDCRALGCINAIEGLDAYAHLRELMQAIGAAPNSGFVYEPFLSLPHSKQEILSELKFLGSYTPDLLRFFEESDRTDALIKNIIGLIAPFHETRKGPFTSDQLALDRAIFDRSTIRRELRSAINSAADRANDTRQRLEVHERITHAERSARRDFQIKKPQQHTDATNVALLHFDDPDAIKLALTKIHLLKNTDEPLFWRPSELKFVNHVHVYGLSQAFGDTVPLHVYLSAHDPPHRDRVALILSLVRAVTEWSKVGAFLMDFRADNPELQNLYLVKLSRPPVILIADLAVIELEDPYAEGLLAADWLRGPALAKAFRQIYYGSAMPSQIQTSALFRATWNDNVVEEYAGWLEGALPRAKDLKDQIETLFGAETWGDPFLVGELDDQFIRECINADILAASEALTACLPRRLLLDRARGQPNVYFAAGEDSQIGLIFRGDNLPIAHKLAQYDKRRWSSARERDHQMGVPAPGDPDGTLMFVRVASAEDARNVAEQVFGVEYDRYRKWMKEWLRSAQEHASGAELPAILKQEANWIDWQYARLDRLSGTTFPFQLQGESGFGQSLLIISQGKQLRDHLAGSGYADRDGRLQLNVRGTGSEGAEFQCVSESIEYHGEQAWLTVLTENEADEIPPSGNVSFRDEGTDAVLAGDAAPLRILQASYNIPAETSPAPTLAWTVLSPLIGSEILPPRLHHDSSAGRRRAPEDPRDEGATLGPHTADAVYEHMFDVQSPINCALITGAAGTGKTALVADLCVRFLDNQANTVNFPPGRIVVVAATHYALDNFTRVFRERSGGALIPYRFVPASRLSELRWQKGLDRELYDWSQDHYQKVVSDLLGSLQIKPAASRLQETADHIQRELRTIEAAEPYTPNTPACIPCHETWRSRVRGKRRALTEREHTLFREMLQQRLKALGELKEIETELSGSTREARHLDPYAAFAAPLIITSIDALDRLPDIHCDLLIFEEASQLRLVKLFKVLSKLMRARADGTAPKIIMSGDPRQLPPFLETIEQTDARQSGGHATLLRHVMANAESPFEAIARRHPSIVTVLSRQHRMDPSIAEVVRRLFYRDQIWTLTKKGSGNRVFWHDTSHLLHARPKRDGTSRYNDGEIAVIQRLAHDIRNISDDVLIVSPYAAQVAKLKYAVPRTADVQTIDGCQGRQAKSVIVSFVSLKFSPTSDFVVDPRRMNVALSRASEELHLVGNLKELVASVERTGDQYTHMAGLADLFRDGGLLRGRVRRAALP